MILSIFFFSLFLPYHNILCLAGFGWLYHYLT